MPRQSTRLVESQEPPKMERVNPASIPAHSGPSALDNAEIMVVSASPDRMSSGAAGASLPDDAQGNVSVFLRAFDPSATPPQQDPVQQPTPIGRKNTLTLMSEGSRRVTTFVRETSASVVKSSISTPLSEVKLYFSTPLSIGRIGQGMHVLAAGDRTKKGVVERDHGTGHRMPYRVRWSNGDSEWLHPADIVLDEAVAEENKATAEAFAAEGNERARSESRSEVCIAVLKLILAFLVITGCITAWGYWLYVSITWLHWRKLFDAAVFGSQWEEIGVANPTGRELSNPKLATALMSKTQFTADEWRDFGIYDLGKDDFIQSGAWYYKPVFGDWTLTQCTVIAQRCSRACSVCCTRLFGPGCKRDYESAMFLSDACT